MASLWEQSKHGFERILEESKKATERVIESAAEAGGAARAALERARVERTLFKRFAELGSRVYEHSGTDTAGNVLGEPAVRDLLQQIRDLDAELKRLQGTSHPH